MAEFIERVLSATEKKLSGVLGLSKGPLTPTRGPAELEPQSDAEEKLVSTLRSMLEEAKRAREPWEGAWRRAWEYYIGVQWGPKKRWWRADPTENHVWLNTESMIARLTENRPTINMAPVSEAGREHVEAMQKQMDAWWDRLNMEERLEKGTKNSLLSSKGIYYNYFDHDKNDICCELVSTDCLWVNPGATSIDDCTYLIHATTLPYWDAVSRWKKTRGRVEPGLVTEDFSSISHRVPTDPTDPEKQIVDAKDGGKAIHSWRLDRDILADGGIETDMVQVLQFWIRDPTRERVPILYPGTTEQVTDEAGTPLFFDQPKYPGGRHVVLAGNRIVHDAPNPYTHGQFPYVEQNCYLVPDKFWHISYVFNLLSLQRQLNKTSAQIIENAALLGNGIWVMDKGALDDPDMLTNAPGLKVIKNPNKELKREPGMPLPPFIMDFVTRLGMTLRMFGGNPEASVGLKPPGVQSGVALEQLRQAGATQAGLIQRHMEQAIRRNGEQWVGLARQFYTENRTIRVGPDENGKYQFVEITPEMIRSGWEVRVGAGSTLPVDRNLLMQQAAEYFQIGLFDEEMALEWSRHPAKDKAIKRIRERKEAEMQFAMLQASMGGAPANGQARGGANRAGPPR